MIEHPDRFGYGKTLMRWWNSLGVIVERSVATWETQSVAVATIQSNKSGIARIDLHRDGRSVASVRVDATGSDGTFLKGDRVIFDTTKGRLLR